MTLFAFDLPVSVGVAVELIVTVLALVIAPHGRRPSSALAWILLIVAVPVVGIVLFGLIGSPRLPARTTDWGVPPTAIHTGISRSGRGKTPRRSMAGRGLHRIGTAGSRLTVSATLTPTAVCGSAR